MSAPDGFVRRFKAVDGNHSVMIAFLAVLAGLYACAGWPRSAEHTVSSPDGRVSFALKTDVAGRLIYRVRHDERDLIAWSPLGMVLQGSRRQAVFLIGNFRIVSVIRENHLGASDGSRPHVDLRLQARQNATGRRLDVFARVYDDGAAFRLKLPPQRGFSEVRLQSEITRFGIAPNSQCLAVLQDRFATSHEGEYAPLRIGDLRSGQLVDLPLVCQTGSGTETFALTESDLENYSGAYLVRRSDGISGVEVKLTPRVDDPSVAVVAKPPFKGLQSPWRVVMVADRPERMIESGLVQELAAPSRIPSTDWIAPGKAAWGWWSGQLAEGLADPGSNDETYRHYIDFAERFGLPYLMIDYGWAYRDKSDRAKASLADVMRTTDRVNLPELIEYARKRGVRIWLWANWKALDPKMEEAFAFYEKLGIAGFKVDFLDRQDQEMVAFYHRLLSTAARHRLMVDIHAAYVPRGLERTYPNYMTQEGVLALEYNRWSRRATAAHNVRLAYTRAIIGPMDYTPGGFRNVEPEAFQPRSKAPLVMTSRAHQLGLFVVYPSPFSMLADAPSAYQDARGRPRPGADFLKIVPTVWDETRGLGGEFGRYIVVARRSGDTWYLAALNDERERVISIPLSALGRGPWELQGWGDGKRPADIIRTSQTISGGDIRARLSPRGGGVWVISRAREGLHPTEAAPASQSLH